MTEDDILKYLPVNIHEVSERGEHIYEKLREKLEAKYMGEVVAIEVESGDYFIGKTGVEAVRKAKDKYPNKIFRILRIGSPAYIVFR